MKNRIRICINTFLLTEILTTGWSGDGVQCVEGLPEGAEFVNMGYDPLSDTFSLVFQHESFPPTDPGQMLSVLSVLYVQANSARGMVDGGVTLNTVLNNSQSCDKLNDSIANASQPTAIQLEKFIRRIRALADGRHEIILTVQDGVRDWTVRSLGKVER